jgi:hypothetical protein
MGEKDGGGIHSQSILQSIYGNVTMKTPVQLIFANKSVFLKN